jgi:hypothetical protein
MAPGLIEMPLSRPFFTCWESQDEVVLLKKPVRPRNQVHKLPMTYYCMTNMTVVVAFLFWHEQLSPISAQECCKPRGVAGQGAYLLCACPQQRLTRFASWLAGSSLQGSQA